MESRQKVLLVGWDAADWKIIQPLMAAGKMPHVRSLVEAGASGPISTIHPPLSPMLWTSICTGKRPFRHGIHGFSEPMPDGSGVRPVTNLSRTSKALWNVLQQNGLRSVVIGWWPSHPAEPIDGVMVSDRYHRALRPLAEGWPLPLHCVHPVNLSEKLAGLRVHPDQLTPEMVTPFVPRVAEIDQDRDRRVGGLLRTLAEGMSIQAAASWLMDHEDWDFCAVYYEALDHFCHGFMRYYPPRQSWIADDDFELYRNVVSEAYQFHDRMLGELLAKAGPECTVILMSDHGFHPDHLRPASIPDIPAGPAIEHRDYGVLAMRGPGIRREAALHGASVLDVAPTVLTLYGLPVGEDMDGKVLSQAFVKAPEVKFVASWDEVPGADGRHPPHTLLDPVAAHESLEQMIALGYIERPHADRAVAIERTVRELRFNLGESYQDGGRHREAHAIFSELVAADPGESRFAVRLFVSCQALGYHDEMRRIVERLDEGSGALADYLRAHLLVEERRYAEAASSMEQVAAGPLLRPDVFLERGDLYLRLRRPIEARTVYERALEMDPDNARAYVGLSRLALWRKEFGTAAHASLDALQRRYDDPQAHLLLGRALAGLEQYERAADAYRAAIALNPNAPGAHLRLATLLEKHLGDPESARELRVLARGMRQPVEGCRSFERVAERVADAACETAEDGAAPLGESLVVVTGLPRSGTSLLMQMLEAGGIEVVSDGVRRADEDNPRGYLEDERVRSLLRESQWLGGARGKAIKIVAPLLSALPPGLPCRVIFSERDLEDVLDSQDRMLLRLRQKVATPERRRLLRGEYARTVARTKAELAVRPATLVLTIEHEDAVCDPVATADRINRFLGGGWHLGRMAAAIEPSLKFAAPRGAAK